MNKIAFFIGPFGSGGGERNCCNLANSFAENGIEVDVLTIGVTSSELLNRFDSRVRLIDFKKKHLRQTLIQVLDYLIKEKPGKILAFNHYIASALVLLRCMMGMHFELYMRSIIGLTNRYAINPGVYSNISKLIVKSTLSQVGAIIAQCNAMREDLIVNWNVDSSKCVVINNPLAKEVEALKSPFTLSGKKNEILFVGRLANEKGVFDLIECFSKFASVYPLFSLKVLGDGPLLKSLKIKIEALGLQDKIFLEGIRKDVINFYKSAKLTVLPSYSEGFPNVLIESLALGTPVIAYDCETGPSEIIIEGVNGYLVPLGNKEILFEAITKAISKEWDFEDNRFLSEPIIESYLKSLGLMK